MNVFSKIKKPSLKFMALITLVTFCSPLAINTPVSALPKNIVIQISYGGCTMWFSHGEVFGGAYAKFKGVAGHCDQGTTIQVIKTNLTLGPKCGLWRIPWQTGCSVTAEGATQSFASFSQLFYSQVTMCSNGSSPYCRVQNYTVTP